MDGKLFSLKKILALISVSFLIGLATKAQTFNRVVTIAIDSANFNISTPKVMFTVPTGKIFKVEMIRAENTNVPYGYSSNGDMTMFINGKKLFISYPQTSYFTIDKPFWLKENDVITLQGGWYSAGGTNYLRFFLSGIEYSSQ